MTKIAARTISLMYHPKEDRMLLVINKAEPDVSEFWITRRFYLSLLFELETFLEKLDIIPPSNVSNHSVQSSSSTTDTAHHSANTQKTTEAHTQQEHYTLPNHILTSIPLLDNVSITFLRETTHFKLLLRSQSHNHEIILNQSDFLHFYTILKRSYPRHEWGMI